MTVEHVTVIKAGTNSARILGSHPEHCSQCALKSGCGHQLLATATSHSRQALALDLPLPAPLLGKVSNGDTLALKVAESRLVFLSFLQYLVPLSGMLSATALSSLVMRSAGNELVVILSALAGLLAGLALVRKLSMGMMLPIALALPEKTGENFFHNLNNISGTPDETS